MVSTHIVEVLHLVDSDDPILARESFLNSCELRAFRGQPRASHPVYSLTGGEQRIVVVVRHLVPIQDISINNTR